MQKWHSTELAAPDSQKSLWSFVSVFLKLDGMCNSPPPLRRWPRGCQRCRPRALHGLRRAVVSYPSLIVHGLSQRCDIQLVRLIRLVKRFLRTMAAAA